MSARVAQDLYGMAALHMAARNGQLEVARLLLESGADVNAKVTTNGAACCSRPLGLAGVPMGQGERVVPAG